VLGSEGVMTTYVYAFCLVRQHDDVFFRFPKFPEIISAVGIGEFEAMGQDTIQNFASEAIITALQIRIVAREDIPASDNLDLVKANGFVTLPVQQAMKLELFKLYKSNTTSVVDFSKQIGKKETSARRLLDLHHQSRPTEIEAAIGTFGKRLVHNWDIGIAIHPDKSAISSYRPVV
jgi:antitoxin HicB